MSSLIAISPHSAASLYIQMRFGETILASGTGFLIRRDNQAFLATAGHCLSGRDPRTGQPLSDHGGVPDTIDILHNVSGQPGAHVTRTEALLDDDGQPRWLAHPNGPEPDVVALPLTQLDGVEILDIYDPDNVGAELALGPASRVSIVGFPFGLTGGGGLAVWVSGFVASEPELGYEEQPLFLVDARTRTGQSGSPVLIYESSGSGNLAGGGLGFFAGPVARFLGIYGGRIDGRTDLGYVWMPNTLSAVLAQT